MAERGDCPHIDVLDEVTEEETRAERERFEGWEYRPNWEAISVAMRVTKRCIKWFDRRLSRIEEKLGIEEVGEP